ncbi:MAG TPA: hypothetical protein ENI87_00855, partial [bacterium]|nr:hypothetical protein [bacterium]
MQLAAYVHPFDMTSLRRQGGLARLRDLGFGELAMATSYHDGRWLMPWNARRVRFLEDGCVHFRPAGAYGRLRPQPSSEVPPTGPSPFEWLCSEAPTRGLAVRAWTVFGHNTRLGLTAPELVVENACGDRYPYALCPAQPEVQRYHATLTADLAAHEGLGAIEFEALGQMGFQHSSHHDKKSFAPRGLLGFALSACFCPACCAALAAVGADAEGCRDAVRAFLDANLRDADAMTPPAERAPSKEQQLWVDAVIRARVHTVAAVAEEVVGASGALARAVQVHPDPGFTGSQLAARAARAFPPSDERVLTCYGMHPDAIAALLRHDGMRDLGDSPRRLCIWPKAPEFTSDEDLIRIRELCGEHRIAALAIYHLGLLPWRTIERVA